LSPDQYPIVHLFQLGESKHDGWIYGRYEATEDAHDHYYRYNISGEDLVYLYPDFRTAIVGDWINGTMQRGKEVKITAFRYSYCHFK
jgi:hypothetical protein